MIEKYELSQVVLELSVKMGEVHCIALGFDIDWLGNCFKVSESLFCRKSFTFWYHFTDLLFFGHKSLKKLRFLHFDSIEITNKFNQPNYLIVFINFNLSILIYQIM